MSTGSHASGGTGGSEGDHVASGTGGGGSRNGRGASGTGGGIGCAGTGEGSGAGSGSGDTASSGTGSSSGSGSTGGGWGSDAAAVLSLRGASLALGGRQLWSGLDLDVRPGEFLAVLGANGSGKTTFLRAVLGLQPLSSGTLLVNGAPPRRGSPLIGYVPQQRRVDPLTPLRARDVIALGLDGHRLGPGRASRARRRLVTEAIEAVGAAPFANRPIGLLSGGEQQRIRIGQALATDPRLLLCDEPLLSLDLYHQRMVTALVDQRRRARQTAVVFVTHEINPILDYADRVLYLAGGRFRIGTVAEVMTSAVLSELYGTPIDVLRVKGRILITGMPDDPVHTDEHVHDPVSTL